MRNYETNKLRGAFRGCPHHGDDYEACIQHSGTAPCGVEEGRDTLMKAEALEVEAALGKYHTIHSRDEMKEKAAFYRRQAESLRGSPVGAIGGRRLQ